MIFWSILAAKLLHVGPSASTQRPRQANCIDSMSQIGPSTTDLPRIDTEIGLKDVDDSQLEETNFHPYVKVKVSTKAVLLRKRKHWTTQT